MPQATLNRGLTFLFAALTTTAMAGQPHARPRPTDIPQASPAASRVDRCAALTGTKVTAGVVEGAERFARGAMVVGGETAGAKASADFCRVRVRLRPVPGSDINVEVWLPDSWNNKMYGFGGAGFDGGLSLGGAQLLNSAIRQGYAAVETDVGHKVTPKLTSWANLKIWVPNHPQRIIDMGYRGEHLAAVVAKQVIADFYGDPAKRAYFLGCSNGGRESIMEASRYPDDYDGVIAGAPAVRYVEVVTQLIWYFNAVHGPGGAPRLASKLNLVHDSIMKQCDGLDGVKDGILENPRLCHFNPAKLQCKGADAPSCLTDAEVRALRKIYGGTRLSNGEQVISGLALGSEGVPNSWTAVVTTPQAAIVGQDFYRWMVYDDPDWKIADFNLDRDYRVARARLGPILDADNPDLRAFTRHGGKLIIYQGWDDPVVPPTSTIKYYESVRRRIGPAAARQVRLFMVPGMTHCAGGPGATSFDMQPVLEKWVELGETPQRVIAVKPGSGDPPMSHPLCAWPKMAHYNGSGSTRDAANFTCK